MFINTLYESDLCYRHSQRALNYWLILYNKALAVGPIQIIFFDLFYVNGRYVLRTYSIAVQQKQTQIKEHIARKEAFVRGWTWTLGKKKITTTTRSKCSSFVWGRPQIEYHEIYDTLTFRGRETQKNMLSVHVWCIA